MLDENIENLSPDESAKDIDKKIDKKEERTSSVEKKADVKKSAENIGEKEESSKEIKVEKNIVETDEVVSDVEKKDDSDRKKLEVKDSAISTTIKEEPSEEIENSDPKEELKEKSIEKPEKIEESTDEEPSSELVETDTDKNIVDENGPEKSEEVKDSKIEDKKSVLVEEVVEGGESDNAISDKEVEEVESDAPKEQITIKEEPSEEIENSDPKEELKEKSVKKPEEMVESSDEEPSPELEETDTDPNIVDEKGSEKSEEVKDPKIEDKKPVLVEEVDDKGKSDNAISDKAAVDVESDPAKEPITAETKVKEVPNIDYSKLGLDEIVDIMKELVENFSINKIKVQFESLKSNFNKNYKNFIAEKKEEFIKEGGNEIDFKFYLPVKNMFNDVIRDFKNKRQKHYKDIEVEQKQNHERKLQLIDDLKKLIDTAEPSTMYKNFRSLQDEWRTIGQIPHTKYNDVWRTYHHHVERFYDLLHLNNDFRDLDFKHNLEEKTKLIERVEKLGEDPDVNRAFKELQIIHRMWKEDIGPVGRDIREEVWSRFSEATKKIHDRRHEFQNEMESKFKANVDLKLAVVDKIKSIKTDGYSSHKLWQNAIREIEDLRKEFFAIGRVPRSKNEEVWQLFKDATRDFNKGKNSFYKGIKKEQADNLTKKMQLIEQAESLKDSEDWESVTAVFKKIQAEWKNIGHVPRRDSDKIWKKFKDACNHYFNQLHNMQDGHNKGQAEVFNKKKELLEKFKQDIEQEEKLDLDLVNKYISEWRELGIVPVNMRHIEGKLNKVIDSACKKLNISKEETSLLKFKNVIDAFLEQKDFRKLDNEQLFIKRKVDDLTKEIKQLENNIIFISNATDDNPLVKNVYNNIETYSKDLKIWQRKLTYIRQLDY